MAQNELGVMYAKGRGVAWNLDEAAKWCRLAAAQGSEVAQRNLELAEAAKAKMISELTTKDKKSYASVVLQKVEADGVTVSYLPVPGGLGLAKVAREPSHPAERTLRTRRQAGIGFGIFLLS